MKRHVSSRAGALVALMAAAIFGWSLPAQGAAFFQNFTGTLDGKPLNVDVTITPSAGSLEIILTNKQANPISVIQAISDIHFTLFNGTTAVTGGPGSALAEGTYINIADNGAVSGAGNDLKSWQVTNAAGSWTVTALWGGGGLQGGQGLIIGPGPYTACGGSICGNSGHNPFVDQTATFTLAILGVDANTIISNVLPSFGTDGTIIPIPAAVWLFISGLLGLIGIARRKQVAARSALPMPA